MPWARFPIWDRWRDLTRFWIASESAIASELDRWTTLPIVNPETVIVNDPTGETEFQCSLADYKAALKDRHRLYSMLLAAYTGLVEEHGRNMIEYAIAVKGTPRQHFPGLDLQTAPDHAAQQYVKSASVEAWGGKYLELARRSWADVDGGKLGVVEAFTVRNLTAHGLLNFNQTAINRLVGAGANPPRWAIGDALAVDRKLFREFVWTLRAFGRAVSDVGANLP